MEKSKIYTFFLIVFFAYAIWTGFTEVRRAVKHGRLRWGLLDYSREEYPVSFWLLFFALNAFIVATLIFMIYLFKYLCGE